MKKALQIIIPIFIAIIIAIFAVKGGWLGEEPSKEENSVSQTGTVTMESDFDLSLIPEYDGSPFVTINDNQPDFLEKDFTTESFEYYGRLDYLGRCTACFANIGLDLMPTEKRGNISSVKPTGWHSTKYSSVDGGSLYNRCHLIGYQLTGENANERNLITGTRYLNTQGMLPFEDEVAAYVKTGNHVLYRVTPIFKGNELVARGVQMEGISVEDKGESVCFNVFCYNIQPGIEIDYLTGDSALTASIEEESESTADKGTYILNTKSKKFHNPDCLAVEKIQDDNKEKYTGSRQKLIDEGYSPCGQCNP